MGPSPDQPITTLGYASPDTQRTFPPGWMVRMTVVWAVAILTEHAIIVITTVLRSYRALTNISVQLDMLSYFIQMLMAAGVLVLLGYHSFYGARIRIRSLRWPCIVVVGVVGIGSAVAAWEHLSWSDSWGNVATLEQVLNSILTVAWPGMLLLWMARRPPIQGEAGAIFMAASLVVLLVAVFSILIVRTDDWSLTFATLGKSRTGVAFSLFMFGATILGIVIWRRGSRRNIVLFLIAGGCWLSAGVSQSWNLQQLGWPLDIAFLPDIVAELINTLILWQIAPLSLLAFACGLLNEPKSSAPV